MKTKFITAKPLDYTSNADGDRTDSHLRSNTTDCDDRLGQKGERSLLRYSEPRVIFTNNSGYRTMHSSAIKVSEGRKPTSISRIAN